MGITDRFYDGGSWYKYTDNQKNKAKVSILAQRQAEKKNKKNCL